MAVYQVEMQDGAANILHPMTEALLVVRPDSTTVQAALVSIESSITTLTTKVDGRVSSYVFDDKADLDTWLGVSTNTDKLNVGDVFFLRDTGVPDYWWDGTDALELEGEAMDVSGLEPEITAGTNAQYWRGDKSWQNLAAAVLATEITAPTLTNAAIATGDSIQVVAGKLQAQIDNESQNLLGAALATADKINVFYRIIT